MNNFNVFLLLHSSNLACGPQMECEQTWTGPLQQHKRRFKQDWAKFTTRGPIFKQDWSRFKPTLGFTVTSLCTRRALTLVHAPLVGVEGTFRARCGNVGCCRTVVAHSADHLSPGTRPDWAVVTLLARSWREIKYNIFLKQNKAISHMIHVIVRGQSWLRCNDQGPISTSFQAQTGSLLTFA